MTSHLENFERAVQRLRVVLGEPESMTQREASIHCFEFTFELSWKAIQVALRAKGVDATTPRECLERAWRSGWIDDEEAWVDMLRDRNLTSHTYKDSLAREVVSRLPQHLRELAQLSVRLRTA